MHTTTRRPGVGDKVRSRTGDRGTIVPLSDWPFPHPYIDEDVAIVRWDDVPDCLSVAGMEGFRFSVFSRSSAEEFLTIVERAPTLCEATVMVFDGVDSGELGPCDAPATGTRTSYNGAPFPACDEHAEPQGGPADIAEDDGVHRASSQAGAAVTVSPRSDCNLGTTAEHKQHCYWSEDEDGTAIVVRCMGWTEPEDDTPSLVQLDRDDAARHALAADLRRLAELAESGLLDGRGCEFLLHFDDAASVQAIADALGGSVARYKSHKDTVQASVDGARVGSIKVKPIVNTDAPWGSDSGETWAALVQNGGAS